MPCRLVTMGAMLAIAIIAPSRTRAQTVPTDTSVQSVRPGDGTVRGDAILPHTNRWIITYFTPAGAAIPGGPGRVATWYDSVWVTPLAGRPALRRKQVLLGPGGTALETLESWADRRSMAPIRTEGRYAGGTASLREYRASHVTGFDPDTAAPGGRKAVDTTLAEPVFDFFGGMYDLLLSGFPLHEGYRARFPADLGGARGGAALQWVTLTVTGREVIDTGTAGKAETWHVITGPLPVGRFEFWIADRPPYLMRMWYIGPRGGKQVWNVG